MSLSIPTENRKISGFLFSGDVKKNIGLKFFLRSYEHLYIGNNFNMMR